MANTIGNRPPASIPSAAPTRASTQSAATSTDSRGLMSADDYTALQKNSPAEAAAYRKTITLGARQPSTFTKEQIAGMSDDEVKKITPEQILGFNSAQTKAFMTRVGGDEKKGIKGLENGLDSLGPAEKKAVLRKRLMASLVAEFKKEASKYDKP